MPHYSAYESFKTKKSVEKKERAKEKSLSKDNEITKEFEIENAQDYGIVIEVKYNDAFVIYDNKIITAKLRKDLNLICNQVIFPGDKVVIYEDKDSNYLISNIIKRTTLLSRTKKDSTRLDTNGLTKNIAANVNLGVIVVSAAYPPLHPKFIDRYLMILQNSNIPAIICLNKCDLKTEYEENILEVYKQLGIPVIETSALKNIGIDELKKHLNGKQAIFVGNSGVGKSSLTNAVMNSELIKTSHVSDKSKRGRHTTTTSKFYIWNDDSSIIDTPGIRSLDVSSFDAIEVQDYFTEFENWRFKCKYNDCLHYNEPLDSCFIKQAVANGIINKDRYESYLRIMGDVLGDKDYQEILSSIISEN